MGGRDTALGKPNGNASNFLYGPADQRRGVVRILFGGVTSFAWWRITAIMANASMTSDTGRCHPCQERVSLWSRPSSFLVVSKLSSIAQRWPSTCTSASIPVPAGQKLRVVGNLPYNISSPLLFHLAEYAHLIEDQHFMLQKEVVERMVAEPGSKVYGRLSVMLQWRYDMQLMFIVPPTAFDPPPQVESAIVRMTPVVRQLACDGPTLEAVVMKAFSQRRKVIRNCLAGMFTEAQIIEAGIDPAMRPETVSLTQYVALANLLKPA